MIHRSPVAVLAIVLAFGSALNVQAQTSADVAARAAGTWVAEPEQFPVGDGAATIRRTTVLTATTESLKVEAFIDPAMTQPLLTYSSGGPMTVVGPWEPVPGAFAVELLNARSEVTAYVEAPELWAAINLGACALVVGEAVDISACADGPPFQVVGCTDLDLILLNEDATTLRFGAPGTNRCLERPTNASDLVFARQ